MGSGGLKKVANVCVILQPFIEGQLISLVAACVCVCVCEESIATAGSLNMRWLFSLLSLSLSGDWTLGYLNASTFIYYKEFALISAVIVGSEKWQILKMEEYVFSPIYFRLLCCTVY